MYDFGVQLLPLLRFDSADIEAAHQKWRCNCGPAALAACIGMTPDEVRPYLGDFERRGYMNFTMMEQAVERAGFHIENSESTWPKHGLVRIQFGGPWTEPGANPKWASIHTHWVAAKLVSSKRPLPSFDGPWVFDVNGGWMRPEEWESELLPLLGKKDKRADGTWEPTHVWEVRRGRA